MKRYPFIFLYILITISSCYAMLSVEEAALRISQVEGIPYSQVRYVGLDSEIEVPSPGPVSVGPTFFAGLTYPWPCYVFVVDYPDGKYKKYYKVEPFRGEICYFEDTYVEYNLQEEGELSDMLTPLQAYNIAVAFLRRIYTDFNPTQFEVWIDRKVPIELEASEKSLLTFDPNSPNAWTWLAYNRGILIWFTKPFEHPQATGRAIWFSPLLKVSLDSRTGVIYFFTGKTFPSNISLTPTITAQQAEEIALGLFSYAFYAEVAGTTYLGVMYSPSDTPSSFGHLVWAVDLAVEEEEGEPAHEVIVGIDAHTGEMVGEPDWLLRVVDVEPTKEKMTKFKNAPRPHLPIRIVDKEVGRTLLFYNLKERSKLYITSEQAWHFGVLVARKGKEVVLKYKGESLKVKPPEVQDKDGKLYVPLDAVLKVAGYSAKYVPQNRTIYIEKINNKKEKTQGAIGGGLSLSALSYAVWKFLKLLT